MSSPGSGPPEPPPAPPAPKAKAKAKATRFKGKIKAERIQGRIKAERVQGRIKAERIKGRVKAEREGVPLDHIRPVDNYDPSAAGIQVATRTAGMSWRSRETAGTTREALIANQWYNFECRTVNRQRSMPIDGNTNIEWPIYLRMCDLVTGAQEMAAPTTRGGIERATRARWMRVGLFYDLPWVAATPIAQMRLDYKAFIGALDT